MRCYRTRRSYRHTSRSQSNVRFVAAEIRSPPDAVSLSRSSLVADAVQSETAIATRDEDERVPLQRPW